ncbi:TPA: hypothetical protein SJA95_000284 [Staphylococcus aureus]|nr:hypothetical protein [Staphylococcus aureus]HEI5278612.1 hypothetical protein [Staphylococcus aureus]HEI5392020.1 hypothetical protein [Staphylococcus aureus]HEI5411178.1 hypothetical protein [Staphylococcus aureus]HEI5697359.1 hypothetical protein [Staphylococcus aureus]
MEEKQYLWRYNDIEKRMNELHKKYKELVDIFFGDVIDKNTGYFPFYSGIKYSYADLNISFYRGLIYIHGGSEGMQAKKINISVDDVLKRTERSFEKLSEYIKSTFIFEKVIHDFQMFNLSDLASIYNDDAIAHYYFETHSDLYLSDKSTKIYRTPNSLLENANDLPASLRKYTQLLETVNDKDFETHIVEVYDCFMSEKRLATSLLLGRALELMCRLILNKFDKDIIKQTPDYKRNIRTFLNEMENNDLIEEHLKHSVKAAIEHRNSIMHGIKIEEYNSIIQTLFDEIAKLSNVYKSLNKQ